MEIDLSKIKLPKFDFSKLKLGNIIPNIPILPDIDDLQKNNFYNQIDDLNYSIKLKEIEIKKYQLKNSKALLLLNNI